MQSMDCKLSLEVVAFSLRLFRRCITGIILPFLQPLVPCLFDNRHILFELSLPLFPAHLHLVVNHFFHDIATLQKVVDALLLIAIGFQLLIDEVDLRKIMKLILAVFLLQYLTYKPSGSQEFGRTPRAVKLSDCAWLRLV